MSIRVVAKCDGPGCTVQHDLGPRKPAPPFASATAGTPEGWLVRILPAGATPLMFHNGRCALAFERVNQPRPLTIANQPITPEMWAAAPEDSVIR